MNELLTVPLDLSPLWISLKVAAFATIFTFFTGIAVAYWMLNYRGKGKSLLEGLFISPLILPPTVVGFLLLLIFGKNGFVGQLLMSIDFSIVFTWSGAVITATVVAFPLMYRTALGAFEQIDESFLAVARTLGASEWTVFRRILFPLALPGVLAGAVLAFARALGEFGATLMLAGNIPGQTQTIPMAIYFAVEAGEMDEAWFWAVVILMISLSGIFAVNFWQDQKKKLRSLKKAKPSVHQTRSTATHPSSSGLFVEIQKQLASFDLDIRFSTAKSTLGILGGSGAGKSMLLRCIAGMESPTRGQIVLNGRVLFDAKAGVNVPSRDRKIGFLVQNYALFPNMTVAQNIAFGLPKSLSENEARQRVRSQLEAVQLEGYRDRYPHQLSGGQQQRVALARVLASEPELILLDEPFSALDTHLRAQMEQEVIARLRNFKGASLLVTHNLEEAYRVCQDLLVLEQGHPLAYGSKYDIFERPSVLGVAQLTGCKNISPAQRVAEQEILAADWGVRLQVLEPLPSRLAYVGIRAHQIQFVEDRNPENTFPCWLVSTSETPHRMTVFLKFTPDSTHPQDYHIQAEIFKEKWEVLKQRSFPWLIQIEALRLILLEA
ncbi:MAG: molybdate ABC transporter permease subunit [Leptolyngbya sp. Prado105]|jgi:molybdate transport system permease protein|nr:molybdate ABC transporter permease subunit [Leptolyngbya sp. Prado105]